MKNLIALMTMAAALAFGQSASKLPVTTSVDVETWKMEIVPDAATLIVVFANCTDPDATHFVVSAAWDDGGAGAGAGTKIVKRNTYGAAYAYFVANAAIGKVTTPVVTVSPVTIKAQATARVSQNGKEYIEP